MQFYEYECENHDCMHGFIVPRMVTMEALTKCPKCCQQSLVKKEE